MNFKTLFFRFNTNKIIFSVAKTEVVLKKTSSKNFDTDLRIKLCTGPDLDLSCVRQSEAAPFFENYAELYFDTKHLEKL